MLYLNWVGWALDTRPQSSRLCSYIVTKKIDRFRLYYILICLYSKLQLVVCYQKEAQTLHNQIN